VAAEITEIPSDDIFAVSALVGADGTVTLTVVGEVDAFTAPRLRSLIASQLEGQPRELVLDLSAVEFLGSAGLAALVETQMLARDRDVALRLIATSRAVIRPLQGTGLIDLFTISGIDRH
jgi:anti-sigma B factor antagonist